MVCQNSSLEEEEAFLQEGETEEGWMLTLAQ